MTELFPADASCAHCGKESRLNEAERTARRFDCPFCKQTTQALYVSEARCGACKRTLKLDAQERRDGRFACPYCQQLNAMAGVAPGGPPAMRAALTIEQAQASSHNPQTDIMVGSLAIGAGVVFTLVSLAPGGATYFVGAGPIIFGVFRLVRGLTNRRA